MVTPVLNGVAFVEGCVRNVAEQNFELAEHVILAGGSTDGTITPGSTAVRYCATRGPLRLRNTTIPCEEKTTRQALSVSYLRA